MPDSGIADGATFSSAFWDSYVREQVCVTCTSSTRPTNVEGRLIYETNTDRLLLGTGSGSNWITIAEPPQNWTPTWTQSATISHTVTAAKYKRMDGRCRGWANLSATSAGTASNTIICSLPKNADTSQLILGSVHLFDASASTFYVGQMYYQTATTFSIITHSLTTGGITVPTIASGDLLRLQFDYQMANRYD